MNGDDLFGKWRADMGNDAPQQPHKAAPLLGRSLRTGTPIPAAIAGKLEWRSKTILLVDSNARSRETRARGMRAQGVRVDCVASAAAARSRLAAETYNLILVDPGCQVGDAELLVQEIRTRNSRQLVRFLVGGPLFVAKSLSGANSTSGPQRVPAPEAAPDKQSTPAAGGSDFGQKIRDAEADENLNDTSGS